MPRSGWSSETVDLASGHLHKITRFQFLMAFLIMKNSLAYVKGLSMRSSLQSRSKDICQAFSEIDSVTTALQKVRTDVDSYHTRWFSEALSIGESVEAEEPSIPRICGHQRNRSNVPSDTPEEYYKRTITVPFLDHLCTELVDRFASTKDKAHQALYIVPQIMQTEKEWKSKVKEMASFYATDFPDLDPTLQSLDAELDCWEAKWSHCEKLPESPQESLTYCNKLMFPASI